MAVLTKGDHMPRTRFPRSAAPVAAILSALLLTAACGDVEVTSDSKKDSAKNDETPSSAPAAEVDTSAGEGNWLLGMQSAGGADGETSTTVYVTFNPSTGQATATRMPGVQAASASPELAALLVSADRQWAIPDTGISRDGETSGKLKVYSLATGAPKVVDIRERSGESNLKPIGWAFDPERADTLRVVDTANRVWAVNVAGGKATQEGSLPKGPWVFTNGFNRNTGEPWVESIESDETNPPGNGPADTSPVTRGGGTVLPSGSAGLTQLPASPCRLGAGFTDANDVTWAFCADKPTLTTYYLPKDGEEWTAYGKPSDPVAPTPAGFPLVLPPPAG
jgi:hypothetical protein